jgi:hypothetical protein
MKKRKFLLGENLLEEEGYKVEFKEVKGNNSIDTIKNTCDEYVVALLNYKGGRIIWGITDKERKVVGVKLPDARSRDELQKAIDNKLGQISPKISPSAYKIMFHNLYENSQKIDGLYIVEIEVNTLKNHNQIYATSSNEVFIKTKSGKRKLSHEQLLDEIQRRGTAARKNHSLSKGGNGQDSKISSSHSFTLKFDNLGTPLHEDSELWAIGAEAYHFAKHKQNISFKVILEKLDELQTELIQYTKNNLSNDERISKVYILDKIEKLKSDKNKLTRALELLFYEETRRYVNDPYEIGLAIKGLGEKVFSESVNLSTHRGLDIWRKDHKNIGTVFWIPRKKWNSGTDPLFIAGEADVYDLGQLNMMRLAIPAILLEIVEIESRKAKIELSDLLMFSKWSIGPH